MTTVFVATAATSHFDFLPIGASRAQAIEALLDAWREHAKQTGADPTYLTAEDINVVDGQYGQAFRDGSPYPRRTWSRPDAVRTVSRPPRRRKATGSASE